MNRFYILLFVVIAFFSNNRLSAQDNTEIDYNNIATLSSVLDSINNSDTYFVAKEIDDLDLLDLISQTSVEHSPLLEYISNNNFYKKDSKTILSLLLGLPLVVSYDNMTGENYSLPKFENKPIFNLSQMPMNEWSDYRYNNKIGLNRLWEFDLAKNVLSTLQRENISIFSKGALDLASIDIAPRIERKDINISDYVERRDVTNMPMDYANLNTTEIVVRNWIPSFQTSVQFAQNYISDNWYKGGTSNLNLYMRNFFSLSYIKDDLNWTSEIETKMNIYNDKPDDYSNYRIADDLLRLASNLGVKAISTLYYSLDFESRTQIFNTYNSDKTVQKAGFLAPINTNIGLGMKYEFKTKSKTKYGRNFSLSMNVAPFSYTFRYSRDSNIDLSAYALTKEKPYFNKFGSTLRVNWTWNLSMNTTWKSRLYFNTSYENIEAEWENTLEMAISRYFSTRIYLNLRYDDAVPASNQWHKRLQINELLSFGISYKI